MPSLHSQLLLSACCLLMLPSFFLSSCSGGKKANFAEAAQIEVSWGLVSNFIEPGGLAEAKFLFENKSSLSLGDQGWALYFNISPRVPVQLPTAQPAHIEHINGDWFRLVPDKGFQLAPGQKLEVRYRMKDFVIKETDGPLGLYFVFTGTDGKEEIVDIGNAKMIPFASREQQLRGSVDQEPMQSPELDYDRNASLRRLAPNQQLPLIPEPAAYTWGQDSFRFHSNMSLSYDPAFEKEARFLAEKLQSNAGITTAQQSGGSGTIQLVKAAIAVQGITAEAYRLRVTKDGVVITANDGAGAFYGIQSLLSLIPIQTLKDKASTTVIPSITIDDAPRFAFRSFHLDVGRNFQEKANVLRLLDLLSFYKINHLLFYTTEDEGWRIEIDGLPELTETGGQRSHQPGYRSAGLHPAYGSGPRAYEKGRHGSGFYTKKDFIEILRYAADRHIRIIPEVNFPGHARAAIKSMEARYEKLMQAGKTKEAEEYRLIDPNDTSAYLSAQGYKDNVVDVTRSSVYHFYEKVMDEIARMYQEAGLVMDVIHIGGDEVPNGAWAGSKPAQELMAQHPDWGTFKNLHAYFIRRVLPSLKKRNLKVHCWEEAALWYKKEGGYTVNPEFAGQLVPYIWNNVYDPDLGYRIANVGYPVVLCNVTNFYFDLAYNNHPEEPGLYWAGFVDARDAFTFDPFNMFRTTYTNSMGKPMQFGNVEQLSPEGKKNIIGIEAQLWSETIKGSGMMEYYTLPKLTGFAQSAWSFRMPWAGVADSSAREEVMATAWNRFANTVGNRDLPRLSYLNQGYQYRIPPPGARIVQGKLFANTAYPGLDIRYTTDGSEPNQNSSLYKDAVPVTGQVKLRSFDAAGKGSRTIDVNTSGQRILP